MRYVHPNHISTLFFLSALLPACGAGVDADSVAGLSELEDDLETATSEVGLTDEAEQTQADETQADETQAPRAVSAERCSALGGEVVRDPGDGSVLGHGCPDGRETFGVFEPSPGEPVPSGGALCCEASEGVATSPDAELIKTEHCGEKGNTIFAKSCNDMILECPAGGFTCNDVIVGKTCHYGECTTEEKAPAGLDALINQPEAGEVIYSNAGAVDFAFLGSATQGDEALAGTRMQVTLITPDGYSEVICTGSTFAAGLGRVATAEGKKEDCSQFSTELQFQPSEEAYQVFLQLRTDEDEYFGTIGEFFVYDSPVGDEPSSSSSSGPTEFAGETTDEIVGAPQGCPNSPSPHCIWLCTGSDPLDGIDDDTCSTNTWKCPGCGDGDSDVCQDGEGQTVPC